MKSLIQVILFTLLMAVNLSVVVAENSSDEKSYRTAEVGRESIKVSTDGIGVINDFSCLGCGFKQLKINAETAAYLEGTKIDVSQIRNLVKANVGFVKYSDSSNTVYEIHFSH